MKIILISFAIIFSLFFPIFSVVQEWELENSSINLFASSNTVSVVEYENSKDNIYVKLTKEITKESSGQ